MTHFTRTLACGLGATALLVGCGGEDMQGFPTSDGSEEQLIARAAAFELDTEYTPPPGEALHHHTAGFAKILCSGVFITGLDAEDAAANVGGFIPGNRMAAESLGSPSERAALIFYMERVTRPD